MLAFNDFFVGSRTHVSAPTFWSAMDGGAAVVERRVDFDRRRFDRMDVERF